MRCFEDSGLPEFLKGSWSNTSQILRLERIVPFPNCKEKHIVISLSRPLLHTVETKVTNWPVQNALGSKTGAFVPTPWLSLTNSVHSINTHNHIKCHCLDWFFRNENERKNHKRKSSTPRDLQTYGDRVEIEELEAELSPYKAYWQEHVVFLLFRKCTS